MTNKLTPWGKAVTHAMIEHDLTAQTLAETLRDRGITASRSFIIGMMRGYKGSRSAALRAAINEILGINE